jgi:hypothetical protein
LAVDFFAVDFLVVDLLVVDFFAVPAPEAVPAAARPVAGADLGRELGRRT